MDGVFSIDVFEHLVLGTMDTVLSEIYGVLKPDGVLLISFPGNRIPDLVGRHILNVFILCMRLFGSKYPFMRTNHIKRILTNIYPHTFKRHLKRQIFRVR